MVWGFEHGFIHFFGIESSIPDPQLGSWKHVLKKRQQKNENHQSPLETKWFPVLPQQQASNTPCCGHFI